MVTITLVLSMTTLSGCSFSLKGVPSGLESLKNTAFTEVSRVY